MALLTVSHPCYHQKDVVDGRDQLLFPGPGCPSMVVGNPHGSYLFTPETNSKNFIWFSNFAHHVLHIILSVIVISSSHSAMLILHASYFLSLALKHFITSSTILLFPFHSSIYKSFSIFQIHPKYHGDQYNVLL